jgi:hypothetical protein
MWPSALFSYKELLKVGSGLPIFPPNFSMWIRIKSYSVYFLILLVSDRFLKGCLCISLLTISLGYF